VIEWCWECQRGGAECYRDVRSDIGVAQSARGEAQSVIGVAQSVRGVLGVI
jgi:hypothetical protein